MAVKQAVVERFRQICAERTIRPNELANLAGGNAVYGIQHAG